MTDNINSPKHYTSHPSGVECIQIVEQYPYNIATAMAYLWRCEDKHSDPEEDIRKAIWHLEREIFKRKKATNKKKEYTTPAKAV